jgi:hypothetical protein
MGQFERGFKMEKNNLHPKNKLSLDQIKKKYVNEWVLIVNPVLSDETKVQGGTVVFNSKDRGEIHRNLSKFKGDKAIVFTGKIPEDLGILFLWAKLTSIQTIN